MTDAEFRKKVLRQFELLNERLDSIDQRLESVETDVHTIKTVLQIDEQIENLRTLRHRPPTATPAS